MKLYLLSLFAFFSCAVLALEEPVEAVDQQQSDDQNQPGNEKLDIEELKKQFQELFGKDMPDFNFDDLFGDMDADDRDDL